MALENGKILCISCWRSRRINCRIICDKTNLKIIIFERSKKPRAKNILGVGLTPKIWRYFPDIIKNEFAK